MERLCLSALLLVFILNVTTVCGNDFTENLFCPQNLKAFKGSCYEFVTEQRSFLNAQAGCERSGGHLAFIDSKETQQFLQNHLNQEQNWWIGLAPASFSGSLNIFKASGQTLSCSDNHAMLKCDSGQVIELDECFYGRNTVHYCTTVNRSISQTSHQDRCSWVDVMNVVSDLCKGQQMCEVPVDPTVFGEPCPQLGSYLSIKYHCINGYKDNKLGYHCHTMRAPLPTTASTSTSTSTTTLTSPSSTPTTTQPQTSLDTTTITVIPCSSVETAPSCQILPSDGSIFTPFRVTCGINPVFCCNELCTFRLKTSQDDFVYTGNAGITKDVFLSRDVFQLTVTVTNKAGQQISTDLQVQVTDTTDNSIEAVQNVLSNAASLQSEGLIQTSMLAKLFEKVSATMDTYSEDEKKQLLENMTQYLCNAMSQQSTTYSKDEVTTITSLIQSLVSYENQLTSNSKTGASCVLQSISQNQFFLLNGQKVASMAFPIVSTASTLLKLSAESDEEVTRALLKTMDQIHNAMLANKELNTEPVLITSPLINLYANRLSPANLNKSRITTGSTSAAFSLPASISRLVPSDEPVNLRMISFRINPFAWNKDNSIHGIVGSLSLSRDDGSNIPVENLDEEIEIFLPVEGGASNKTILNLKNYSTMAINMTAPNISLVLKLEPSDKTPLMLNLGFQYYPNDTTYIAKTQFPKTENSPEKEYTWLLTPKDVTLEVGVYYLLVRPIVSPGVNSSNMSVLITSIAASCKYWNENLDSWSEHGCRVRITVLEDNDPMAEYRYVVAVTTGHRYGAATTSNVTLTLIGTVWESKPHHLTDPEKTVFTRGGVDIFLLTTPFSLGDLKSIRLWHDNSGEHPDWYVNKVMVQDLETGQIWQFLCNSWLAIDLGDCTLDKVISIASENDLKGFRNLFFTKTAKDLCDGHIWYSVLNRPANSNFTRVQRLSCCFSLLLCTMLTSIMFWGVPKSPSEQDMEIASDDRYPKLDYYVSCQPFDCYNIPKHPPPEKQDVAIIQDSKSGSAKQQKNLAEKWRIQTDVTVDIVVKEIKKIVCSLAKAVKCPVPKAAQESEPTDTCTLLFVLEDIIRQQNFTVSKFYVEDTENDPFLVYKLYRQYLYKQLWNLEKELRMLGPWQFPKPENYIKAVLQVQGMKQLLEPYLHSNPMGNNVQITDPDEEKNKKCYQKGFPWWFVFVGWILVAATSGVSAFFTMMYGLTYGKERSISWLVSISVSFFESLFVTQPIKVLGFAVFFALVVKNIKSNDENYFRLLKDMKLTYTEDPDDVRISRRDSACSYYQPPPAADIEKMRINYFKNQKAFALFKEIIIYLAFLCVLLVATYGQRDPNAYYLTQHIQQSFSNGIADSMSAGDVFTWANNVLLSNLYGQYPGFITDGNSKLVGSARLRQIRVRKDSCRISKDMQHLVHDCHAPYSWDIEDMGSYGPGWNRSRDGNVTENLLLSWQYQTQSKLRGHPIWGKMAFYRGGGFVLDLGLDPEQAISMLHDLFDNKWLDVYTRAIFVEFTVFNANVNLFCIVTLMLETTAVGAFQYSSELHTLRLYQTTDGISIVASEVIYFLFILYYMFLQIKKIKQEKLQYFRSKLNILELAIILLSLAAVGAIINRTVQGNQDLAYFQNHKDQFPSFYDTASADSTLGYILAFLILLGTVKMWHLLRLNSKLNLITKTLKRAWADISSFIVVLVIMILAYSILILNLNPVLGAFLILSCIIFMTFVVLNLFISVILEAFSYEQKHYKPSEEEEIVDLMMMKICRAFGIQYKKK
ncbi:Polycystic kidney disease protein 1-like 2 [Bagarius yarrelli]|uniref:Polycystic kidney disease protein 1-like 2 n=1 Tax=Bagarius yarrelli TaxID=175774 RepID=A0A556VCD0_BAGYA|nr:Polycystic kidney disease protein 1-like 2 [Bagarius yarrelli]